MVSLATLQHRDARDLRSHTAAQPRPRFKKHVLNLRVLLLRLLQLISRRQLRYPVANGRRPHRFPHLPLE
jgi:hypothetical protein